jgi:hypothetical protein
MKLKKIIDSKKINEASAVTGGLAGSWQQDVPEPQFIMPRTKRVLNNPFGKPEVWFDRGGYTQMSFPEASDMFGMGKGKDDESQQLYGKHFVKNTGIKYELDLDPTKREYEKFEDLKEIRKNALSILKNIQIENLKFSDDSLNESTFVFHYGQGSNRFAHELKAFNLKSALKAFIDMYKIPKSEWDKIVVKKSRMF